MQNNDGTYSHIIINTIHNIHIICIIHKLEYAALPKDVFGHFVSSQYIADKTLQNEISLKLKNLIYLCI